MRVAGFAVAGLLSACVEASTPLVPLTLPIPDGRAQSVKIGLQSFVVSRRAKEAIDLRVTRINGADLDYSEGVVAKKAAEAYCASYRRGLDPAATGRFSLPNAWVFGGDSL